MSFTDAVDWGVPMACSSFRLADWEEFAMKSRVLISGKELFPDPLRTHSRFLSVRIFDCHRSGKVVVSFFFRKEGREVTRGRFC